MLDAAQIAFLQSPGGSDLLEEARSTSGELLTRLTRLRRRHPPERASAALELLALRARATIRFSLADRMFFTAEGLEQASGERVARWRAGLYPAGPRVLDLCCGVGGDAAALGGRGPVIAIDRDRAAALCARANAQVAGCDEVAVACADVTRLRLCADTVFFDPSRRVEGRRVRAGALYSPPLSFVEEIRRSIPHVGVKVSPAIDDGELEELGARVDFISDRGECKEAMLWFGGLRPGAARRAVLLPEGAVLESEAETRPVEVGPVQGWLYEPDPAVIRAHLLGELTGRLGAAALDPSIAYLTADGYVETPFATAYRVLEWMPFNLKRLQARLRALGRRVQAIKRRGVPLDPAELAGRLTGDGAEPAVVVLTRLRGAPAAVICEPPPDASRSW